MTCATDGPSNQITVEQARKLNDEMEREPLQLGDDWYIISHSWWMRFMELKDNPGPNGIVELPPINNDVLVKKTDDGYELKPKLVESLNFILVPERVFKILKTVFGVESEERDIIKRTVVEGTLMEKKVFVEVYPVEVKVAHLKYPDRVVSLRISQTESIDEVCAKAMDALSISKSDRNNVRFLMEENGKYVVLSSANMNNLSMNAFLLSGAVIYIDSGEAERKLNDATNTSSAVPRRGAFKDSSPLRTRGLCGLQNLGNTCFMNSALQCLSNVPELTQYFLSGNYLPEINEDNVLGSQGRLARAYGLLMNDMWSENAQYVKPSKLKAVIGEIAPRFNGYNQQDSQELTSFLLDGLHEDLNRVKKKPYIEEKEDDTIAHELRALQAWNDYKKRNDSIIVDLLHGQLKSTVVCPICDKISVKFDPFCFLSVPVPAKERQTCSVITLIRSDKWAKFAITHSNKSTVSQAIALMKSNLQLPESTRIVFLTSYALEIMENDAVLTPSPYATCSTIKNYYAYIVEEGPLMVVENKSSSPYDRILGVPLVVNFPGDGKVLSRKLVLDHVVPVVRDRLWKKQKVSSDNEMTGDEENVSPADEKGLECQQPSEIIFYCDKKYICLPTEIEQTAEISEDTAMDFKVTLRWKYSENFQQVDLSRFVERELNMTTPMKNSYSLTECLDLFTSQEQLDQNDSWYCPCCKKHQRAFKKLDLWNLPKILIVHLKRFQYSRYSREKIDTQIIIPTRDFDLSCKLLKPNEKPQKYDLIAISNHMGGLGSGHYTALALNGDRWVDFNDSSATPTKSTKNSMSETITSREAYILYYRRQDDDTTTGKTDDAESVKATATNKGVSPPKKTTINGNFAPSTRASSARLASVEGTTGTNNGNNSTMGSPTKRRPSDSMKMEVDENSVEADVEQEESKA